jgi:hypothetical protein
MRRSSSIMLIGLLAISSATAANAGCRTYKLGAGHTHVAVGGGTFTVRNKGPNTVSIEPMGGSVASGESSMMFAPNSYRFKVVLSKESGKATVEVCR